MSILLEFLQETEKYATSLSLKAERSLQSNQKQKKAKYHNSLMIVSTEAAVGKSFLLAKTNRGIPPNRGLAKSA
jgi:hypothetical protein